MDPLNIRAQRHINSVSSAKTSSKRNKRSEGRKKKTDSKRRKPHEEGSKKSGRARRDKTQDAGEPSGGADDALERSERGETSPTRAASKAPASRTRDAGEPSGTRAAMNGRMQDAGELSDSPGGGSAATIGNRAALYAVGALHAVDMGLGLALIIYAGFVNVIQVTVMCACYGVLLLLGAVAGAVGHCSAACGRGGLGGSVIAGLITCFLDVAAFVLVLVSWDNFVAFLSDNRQDLHLREDSVKTIGGLKIFFAVIFLVLAMLEAFRFCFMWTTKATSSNRVAPLAKKSKGDPTCCGRLLSLFALKKQKRAHDLVVFDDDDVSIERSLLWSGSHEGGSRPEDYMGFVSEHERGLAERASDVAALPAPPRDRFDY